MRDGIHLRQTAQQDPLNAWQKEGYLMFEHLLEAVDSDYVRYITHVEATAAVEESVEDEGLTGALTNANEVAPGATELPAHTSAGPAKSAALAREAWSKRSLLVRLEAQVQAVPWPTLKQRTHFASPWSRSKNSSPGGRRRATTSRWMRIGRATRCLSELAADPNLWDDQDHAREVTTELGRLVQRSRVL